MNVETIVWLCLSVWVCSFVIDMIAIACISNEGCVDPFGYTNSLYVDYCGALRMLNMVGKVIVTIPLLPYLILRGIFVVIVVPVLSTMFLKKECK